MKTIEVDAEDLANIIQDFQINQESERPLGNFAFAQQAIKSHKNNGMKRDQNHSGIKKDHD